MEFLLPRPVGDGVNTEFILERFASDLMGQDTGKIGAVSSEMNSQELLRKAFLPVKLKASEETRVLFVQLPHLQLVER